MTHNKANKSKILALILGLTMCLALMLGIVFASPASTVYADGETLTPYDRIYINNNPLNNGYYLKTSDGDQLKGNPDTGYVAKYKDGVLTLNNFNGGNVGISPAVSGYFTINLIGDNIITDGQNGVFIDGEHEGRVTITSNANGKLTINVSSDISAWGIACGVSVVAKNIDVVIGGNAQVTINTTSSGKYKAVEGIHARNVTIKDNASVKITAKNTNNETESNWVKGIFAKENVTINTTGNIDIDATVAGNENAYSYGIQALGSTTFTKVGNMTIKYKNVGSNGWAIVGGDVDNTTHAVNEYSISNINFASYRYGTPRYVAAINGTLAGPGVPKEANRGSGYFLAGDLVTLNAPSLQVSETDTTNIPFDKWFSFASDAVITNATSQNGAKLTVQDKNVEVRANYNAFTAQPVFERVSDTEGKVTFTLISNEFNQGKWLKIRPINDLTISKGNVVSFDGTTYNATLSDTGTVYGTPAGEYVVEVVYNNRTLYSEPFTVDYTEKKATIDSVTIFGEQGEAIVNTDITVTLTGYTFETALSGNWITNLPAGLVQSVKRISDTEAKITVSGKPTALSDQIVNITIPKANITGLASDLTAESNSDAKFNIVAPLKKVLYPKVKDIEYNGKPQSGVEEGEGYTLANHIATNAGEYKATATLESGYKWSDGYTERSRIVKWTIKKRTAKAEDFIFTPPSNLVYDNSGKRPSVKIKDEFNYTGYLNFDYKCGESVVLEPVDAGEYKVYVNVSSTENFNPVGKIHDASWKFTIANASQNMPDASRITTVAPTSSSANDGIIHGIGNDMEYRKEGDALWTQGTGSSITGLSSGNYEIRYKAKFNYDASPSITVTVPESGVISYSLTVNNGTGGGVFTEGASVTITANAPATGKRFSGWTIDGITGLDTTQTSITFNMPANAVTATANYEDIEYTITVNGGTADKAKAKYGESVTITANAPATGKEFDKWVVTGITLSDEDLAKSTVTFEMPASNVTMEATYKDVVYRITVTNGNATPEMAAYQTEVTVTANAPGDDEYFDKWEVTGLDTTGMDLTKTEIKFNMPAGNVTFKATYLSVTKYGIVIVDGTKDKEVAKEGETITITAKGAPTGKVFDKWTCETAGVTIEFASATSSKTTFVMPAREIEIKAHFRDVGDAPSVEIKVKGGTGAGVVKKGESITVTANDPAEGKVFKGWKDENGKIVSTKKEYTFTVKEATTLTAVYEDKSSGGGEITPPAKKDGLSGGQIAGIVIGSVLLAGLGGFAVLWFAVKKKTLTDLGTAFKKFFEKIKNLFKKKK